MLVILVISPIAALLAFNWLQETPAEAEQKRSLVRLERAKKLAEALPSLPSRPYALAEVPEPYRATLEKILRSSGYESVKEHKAIAFHRDGTVLISQDRPSPEGAIFSALNFCEADFIMHRDKGPKNVDCEIYAVDMNVIWQVPSGK
jgi:hypothetical protein